MTVGDKVIMVRVPHTVPLPIDFRFTLCALSSCMAVVEVCAVFLGSILSFSDSCEKCQIQNSETWGMGPMLYARQLSQARGSCLSSANSTKGPYLSKKT